MRNPNALEVYQQMALRFVLSLDDMDIDRLPILRWLCLARQERCVAK